jgi:hypothetical protein
LVFGQKSKIKILIPNPSSLWQLLSGLRV